MTDADIKYWRDTIKMCEAAHEPRVKRWKELKERLGTQFIIKGVSNPVIVSRFYKVVRETIASVAFRYPHVFIKAEEDPADPLSGDVLSEASEILEDFGNDGIQIMRVKPSVQQALFDTMFCSRGWLKIGHASGGAQSAPYTGSDAMPEDFTCIHRVAPENILIDPLTAPHDMYTARYIIEVMYPAIEDVIADPRFENYQTRLKGLRKKAGGGNVTPLLGEEAYKDDTHAQTMKEAHRLAGTRKMYEIHDRVNRKRIVFIDGIEEPIEEIEHPFVADVVVSKPDPANGRPLLAIADPMTNAEGVTLRKRFLVEGGFQYYSMAFDVSDDFYPEPMMAYANPIQNAIIKSISRRLDLLDRYRRLFKIQKAELEDNPNIVNTLKNAEDGEGIPLNSMDALQELNWGNINPDQIRIEQDMLRYEQEIVRSASNGNPDTATEAALSASEAQLNREFNQQPVEEAYIWAVRNMFTILADERYTPTDHKMSQLTTDVGGRMVRQSLQAWMLRGVFNINIAAGSMNVLYEQMQKDKALSLVNFLRQSPNVDQKALDEYVIRAHGEIDPDRIMKDDANIDAAKAAELEIQMFFAGHDPGVTQGEDHETHIRLQSPQAIQKHPQFMAMVQNPGMAMAAQRTLQIAQQHVQQHQGQMQQKLGGSAPSPRRVPGANSLIGQVQSNAQQVANTVERQVEEQ